MPPFTNSNPGNMPDGAPVGEIPPIEMNQEQEANLLNSSARVRHIIHIALQSQDPEVRYRIVEKCQLLQDIIEEIFEVYRGDFFEEEMPRFNALLQDLEDDVRMNLI